MQVLTVNNNIWLIKAILYLVDWPAKVCCNMTIRCKITKHIMANLHSINTATKIYVLLCTLAIALSGCTTTFSDSELFQDKSQRSVQLSPLKAWTIKGKIAFITPHEKQSANLYWQQAKDKTTLKLTTFFGVNMLALSSENDVYTLTSEGKTWQDNNLEHLLTTATGLNLPVKALIFWIKGLKASPTDSIHYSTTTNLPEQLYGNSNDRQWLINYQSYQLVNNFRLANKLTIKHRDLTIKLAINSWHLD